MANIISLTATDGTLLEFYDEVKSSGGMKDCYFSTDSKYVCLVFRDEKFNNAQNRDRLEVICDVYKKSIFGEAGGGYWKELFVWPEHVFIWNNKIGITSSFYDKKFFFSSGKYKGKEKEGKWFASAKLRNKFIEPEHKGNFLQNMQMCLKIARAVRRMHAAGLAHSDLSYKNVLVDPSSGSACVIDCDGLVVPGKYPPDVVGTPDFIAPEVLETRSLELSDSNKKLPNIKTDCHALAVLIYMYLLQRHPLRGGKVNDLDTAKDEELSMGKMALFVEHPTDKSNRPKIKDLSPFELPQGDVNKMPYTLCGPYIKELFDKAFITGLHKPQMRPSALEWEQALVKTTDLIQPCNNPNCEAKWFVFDNSTKPKCPFCGTEYHGQLPVLNFYYSPKSGVFRQENYRLMVYDKQTMYMWHVNRFVEPNEKLKDSDKKPVADFHFFKNKWILINRRLPDLWDKDRDRKIEIGQYVELTEGKKILLGKNDGDRLIIVQIVDNK